MNELVSKNEELDASRTFSQRSEIVLRNEQATDYWSFVKRSRGAYWMNAQVGLALHALELSPRLKIYDAGAGIGIYSLAIAKRLPQVHILAVDFSSCSIAMLDAEAKKLGLRNIQSKVADVTRYQPCARAYDRALCIEVLQHLPNHQLRLNAIRNIYNALEIGGIFVTINYRWGGWIKSPAPKEETDHGGNGLYRFAFEEGELKDLLLESGFRTVNVYGIIRTPRKLQKHLSAFVAVALEQCLNTLNWNDAKAQYLLAIAQK